MQNLNTKPNMHSLFIGPYRQNNYNGLCSLSILHHLAATISPPYTLSCRNLYIDNVNIDKKNLLCDKFADLEHLSNVPDTIIQHVPVDSVYVSNNIYNICIPIIDSTNIDVSHIARLAACNKILVDNLYAYELMSKILINQEQIHYISYNPILTNNTNNINAGAYAHTKKFYFIGDYRNNIDLLYDLILSFILCSNNINNISLLLFLSDISNKQLSELNTYVEFIYSSLGVSNIFPKVHITNINLTLDQINFCHQIGDIYFNINDDNKNALQANYAKVYSKKTIDVSDLVMVTSYKRNNIVESRGYNTPLQSSIISAINSSEKTNSSNVEPQQIEKILWP